MSFDGTDDRVIIANSASLSIACPITVVVWFRGDKTIPTNSVLWAKSYGHTGELSLANTQIRVTHGDGSFETITTSAGPFTPDIWFQVAFTRIANPKKISFYQNREYLGDASYTKVVATSAHQVWIGARAASAYVFPGSIALLRVHNRVLSALEIQNHYQREKHLFGVW